jgi:hypothetical protein
MTHNEYLILKNTVRVMRLSGVPLDPEQESKVQRFEAAIKKHEKFTGAGR